MPEPWRSEDGGPRRTQTVDGALGARGRGLEVTTRMAPACTMVVGREDGALFLLRHTAGDGAVAVVDRIHPRTLEPLRTSAELAGGPVWPGGLAVHADGSIHVVFGNHAHRLGPDLDLLASCRLPRARPYNSFVTVPDGRLVTKDFGGSLPGRHVPAVDRLVLPEPSIARLSADGDDIYVVGDTSLLRVRWDGSHLVLDADFTAPYRTLVGQTYGWDCVIAAGAAWFLDDGEGSEHFAGTLRGIGVSTAPLHLVRVDLTTSAVRTLEICGKDGGLVANPPIVDEERGVVVGYDSGNGVLVGFDVDTLAARWRRDQDHASHLVLYRGSGELVTGDGADVVILDVATGEELARADTGSGMQSVLFPCPGPDGDVYVTSLFTVSRVAVRR
jgi:hypothetical protein